MRRASPSLGVAVLLTAAVLLPACSSGSSTTPTHVTREGGTPRTIEDRTDGAATSATEPPGTEPPDTVVETPPDAAEAEATLAAAYDTFDPADVDGELARASVTERAIELAMARQEGMEDELGGADATVAAFEALDAAFAPLGESLSQPVALGLRRTAGTGSAVAEGLVGGVIIVGLGADGVVTASNDGTTGSANSGNGVTATVTDDKVVLDIDVTHTANGLTSRLKTHVELNPCPDAEGVLTLKASVDVTSTTESGAGQTAVLDVDVVVQLDDDARVSGTDDTFRMRRSGLTGGSFWDVTVGGGVGGTTVQVNDFNWFTSEVADRDETVGLAAVLGQLVKKFLMDAAAKAYESGRCIDLQITANPGPGGLEPDATSTITAAPRGKKDGQPVGGTVTAELTAGATSIEPSATKVDADATFTFTAPDDVDLTGTVSFESRSRRGVGKAELTLDTKAECVVGVWTLDNDSMTALLAAQGAAYGASIVASGGPITTEFTSDHQLTHTFNGFTITTDVPEGTLTAVYSGRDTGTWKRLGQGSYTIATLQAGTHVDAKATVAGMSVAIPVDYAAVLQPDVPLACQGDQLTATTPYGSVTLTRVE